MTLLTQIKTLVGTPPATIAARIAVFGDSHTAALLQAQQFTKRRSHYDRIRVYRLRKEKAGKTVGDWTLGAFCDEIRDFSETDCVFSAVGGSQYALLSTVRHPLDYDFAGPAGDHATAVGEVSQVPFRAMEHYFEQSLRDTIGPFFETMRSATRARLFHLAPPPPKEDNAFISAHLESRFVAEGFDDRGPSRPELRLKCWRLQLERLQALCDNFGIDLIMPPSQAVTGEGYLDPFYYADDVTHANRRYGEQVLRQILQLAGEDGGQEATGA
jgi:hypothetical protein